MAKKSKKITIYAPDLSFGRKYITFAVKQFNMRSVFIFLLLIGVVSISSCSNYNKIAKGDDYEQKKIYADKFYTNEQWDRSATLYEQIYQRYSKGPVGEESYFRLAKSHYMMEDYYLAGYYFKSYSERFFLSPFSEEATFLGAMCAVKNSPNYTLDQTETRSALLELQNFIDIYPQSNLVDSCNSIMDRLRLKLEQKAYESAKLYDKMENYRASVTAFDSFVEEYPTSDKREEALFLATKSQFLLAQNSVESKKYDRFEDTIKRSRKFASLFPNSKYLKDIESFREKSEKELETIRKTKIQP